MPKHWKFKLMMVVVSPSVLLAAGCTPTQYARQADRQTNALVRDREKRLLDYTPQADPGPTSAPYPQSRSYAPVPLTDLPQEQPQAIYTLREGLPIVPLGPSEETAAVKIDSTGVATVRNYATRDLFYGPPTYLGGEKSLGLFEAVAYAVQNSREYQDQMESLYIVALQVTLERHLFEPRPFANIGANYRGGQGDNDYNRAFTITSQVGVRQQLPYGGDVTAAFLVDFVNGLNSGIDDGESARVAIGATIPLLRGAGLVNLEGLIQSERNLIYSVRTFETYRRNFAIQVASAYFNLLTTQQNVRNRYIRYTNAVTLLIRTEALYEANRFSALEVQRAQSEVLNAEDSVNQTVTSYENALDDFKLLLGMPIDRALRVVPVALDVPQPTLDVDLMSQTALRYRLDLQTTKDRVEDAKRRLDVARNGLLPDLTLDLDTSLGNSPNTPGVRLSGDNLEYSAGINLDLPLDRLAERNSLRRALIDFSRSQRDVAETSDLVRTDVRAAIREIRTNVASLELQRQGIANARERVDLANERLLTGRSTDSRDVVEAQNQLLTSQDNFERARARLQITILTYLRDTGLLRLDRSSGELGIAMDRETDELDQRDSGL